MADHTGRRLYPLQTNFSPARDCGPVTKTPMTGLARGGTNPDFNVKLRGIGVRIDKKPRRPYTS